MTSPAMATARVAVIGGGPGGYAAAFEAADHGLEVTLIDADTVPGGVCLHRGCIPSKALLHVAKLVQEAREASHWGLSFGKPTIDVDRLREWKNSVVGRLTGGVSELCKRRGVRYIQARATFRDSESLALQPVAGGPQDIPATLHFQTAILATGSVPALPPAFQVQDPRVMDSTGALQLAEIPKSLLVVGGGYIGLELGSVYAALGSQVTVVELTAGLLPGVDRDLVRPLAKRLEGLMHKIHLNTKVVRLEPTPQGIQVELEGEGVEPRQRFDRVLVAIGRRPNSQGLGLDNTKVVVNARGFVETDDLQRTADPRILAIGDVAGEPMLAHKATRQGKVAVAALAGEPVAFDNVAIPAVVFTDPEIAWCGLTENEAKAQSIDVQVIRFPWAASGRAQTIDRTEGMTKLLIEPKTERVLGMGIVGAGAGELIAEGVLAVEMAATAHDVGDSIHPHPTLSETIMESADGFFGHATHMIRPRREK
ncbi:MAG: dihydrolipoyl dehydrogenase [Planctomycetota bacterium]